MTKNAIQEPLGSFLSSYYRVNVDAVQVWREQRNAELIAREEVTLLRTQLAHAIRYRTMSPEDYCRLTDDNECCTSEEVQRVLLNLWQEMFDQEPLPDAQRTSDEDSIV